MRARGVLAYVRVARMSHVCVFFSIVCTCFGTYGWWEKVYDHVAWIRYRYWIFLLSCTITRVASRCWDVLSTCLIIKILKQHVEFAKFGVPTSHPVIEVHWQVIANSYKRISVVDWLPTPAVESSVRRFMPWSRGWSRVKSGDGIEQTMKHSLSSANWLACVGGKTIWIG